MIRLIKKWVTNTFGFSRTETNGSLILVSLVMLVAILPRWFINTQKTNEVSSTSDEIQLQQWFNSISFSEGKELKDSLASHSPTLPPLTLKSFDPNMISLNELLSMGIPGNVANNLINYRKAGGSFRSKTDLQKIYGMSENLYNELEDFLTIHEKQIEDVRVVQTSSKEKNITIPEPTPLIAINTATAQELESIRGIGPTLSVRIVKYRDLLGGFHSKSQLHEVYGLNEEVIEEVIQKITIDSIRATVNINSDDIKILSSHPYIDYPVARAIINYKKVHGAFKEKSEVKKIKIVSDSLYNKLSPYISVRP
ncbi:MAG: helix-hairpin-helix domain-containing protein [Cyclobacteriaceae bacterium]|nr:helix-hairpin-helix domain-containing protein [Cyclobacteriaceae bacterium SS2]